MKVKDIDVHLGKRVKAIIVGGRVRTGVLTKTGEYVYDIDGETLLAGTFQTIKDIE